MPPAAPADGQTSCSTPRDIKHHNSDGVYPILTLLREIYSKIWRVLQTGFILIMIQILISEQSIIYAPLDIQLMAFSHIFPSKPGEYVLSYSLPIL